MDDITFSNTNNTTDNNDDIDYDIGEGGIDDMLEMNNNSTSSNNTDATTVDGEEGDDGEGVDGEGDDQGQVDGPGSVGKLMNEDGTVLIGYQCDHVVQTNTLNEVNMVMYLDIMSPIGQQKEAINFLAETLVEDVAKEYEINNGKACTDPHLDGRSWLVQFTANPTDFKRVELFEECRKFAYDNQEQECFVYEALVQGSALGVQNIPDVMNYVQDKFATSALSKDSKFGTAFLGIPVEDPGISDSGRDNLAPPSNLNAQEEEVLPESEGHSITIIGGFLVALFCVGFIGIGLVLYRRRKAYIEHNREMRLSLSKDNVQSSSDMRELDQYGTPHCSSDEEHQLPRDEMGMVDQGHEVEATELASPTPTEEDFPNMTFDMGSTFKNQLMGVHSTGPPGDSSRRLGGGGRGGNLSGLPGFGGYAPSADGTDASETDSWAQTEGTIGSLEIQLEPVTAEV